MAGKREKPEDIVLKLRQFKGCAGCHSLSVSDIPKVLWREIYRQEGESVNARVRDELLNCEVFTTLREAQILIERWRCHYNAVRPHSALGCRPPTLKSIVQMDRRPTMH
jgi:putative transposase